MAHRGRQLLWVESQDQPEEPAGVLIPEPEEKQVVWGSQWVAVCVPRGHKTSHMKWLLTEGGTEYWCQGECAYSLSWCFFPWREISIKVKHLTCFGEWDGKKRGLCTQALPHCFLLCFAVYFPGSASNGGGLPLPTAALAGSVNQSSLVGKPVELWSLVSTNHLAIFSDVALLYLKWSFHLLLHGWCISQFALNSSEKKRGSCVSTPSDTNN